MRRTTRAQLVGVALFALCMVSAPCLAERPYVELADTPLLLASDQPRVAVEVFDPNAGGKSMGPTTTYNTFLLDTGAQGLIAVGPAVDEMVGEGYQTSAVFDEMGVGGLTHAYDVSYAYDMDFAGTDGNRIPLTGVRLLSDANMSFGGFNGIIGTPAMLGRVISMDNTQIADGNYQQMGVKFLSSVPVDSNHRYSVPLELRDFPPSGQRDANDPLPTYGPLPFLPVEVRHGTAVEANWLIVDTGAQTSIISTSVAFSLGLDANDDGSLVDDAILSIPIIGAGGTVIALLMEVDAIHLLTNQNIDLVWSNCSIIVVDIDPSIPGVIGMDLLTEGWFAAAMGGDPGCIDYINVDLLDSNSMAGTMYLDIEPSLDVVVPAPPALAMLIAGASLVLRRRRSGAGLS